ncbi:MAG: outer membrane beta-barrel protein [Bacteroidales bacterium]|nr:outer membrane beta-barrel protein [Bacteroidales bacterium]
MKNLNIKILHTFLVLIFVSVQVFAQKDTTEFELGKKKLIIIDKKNQKENAIYNLEKGKETFEKEIILAEELIKKHEELIKEQEELIKEQELLIKETGELEESKAELEKQKAELEKHRALIELNKKKKLAFESGVREIDKGIEEIEKGLDDIDEELEEMDDDCIDFKLKRNTHKKRFNSHWAGFEFGLFNFANSSQAMANDEDVDFMKLIPEKSMGYKLNIFEFNVPISKYFFGFATGAGLEWNSMALSENINLYEDANGVIQAEYIDVNVKDFKKNKLNAAYITVPLIFEIQFPVGRKKLYFGAGLTGSMRAWSKQKQIYMIDGRKYKDKKLDDFQLSPFRYGITARAGYGGIGLFAEYTPVPLYKEGSGPEIFPVMIGLHIIDF